jgi:Ca-activated chloride channel family protein
VNIKQWPVLAAMLILLAACGPSAARYNNQGNDEFESGEYQAALDNYVSAEQLDPDLAEPYYNAGNTFYRQNDLVKAEAQLTQSLRTAAEPLAQQGRYNLGNAAFQSQNWPAAIENYKQSLLLNPADVDAKHNLELALQQQQQQQEQQQQQQQSGGGQGDQQQNQGGGNNEGDQPQGGQQPDNQGQGQNNQDNSGGGGSGGAEQSQGSGSGGMTPEEAKQILDALGQNSQTLQERLGQQHQTNTPPPTKDW